MKKIEYLNKEKFLLLANRYGGKHWEKELLEDRWDYHSRVVEILKNLKISSPEDVLEMGTMGVTCIDGSHTIDYMDKLNLKGNKTSYIHDARVCPWPFKDKQFEVFIALRVFQHLTPKQEDALIEAFRISKKVILVVPNNYNVKYFPESKGLTYLDYSKILKGIHPNLFLPTNFGDLYYWDTENPNYLNIESVMEHYRQFLIAYSKRKISFFKKVKFKIKKLIS
jgi:hypothetical protein